MVFSLMIPEQNKKLQYEARQEVYLRLEAKINAVMLKNVGCFEQRIVNQFHISISGIHKVIDELEKRERCLPLVKAIFQRTLHT